MQKRRKRPKKKDKDEIMDKLRKLGARCLLAPLSHPYFLSYQRDLYFTTNACFMPTTADNGRVYIPKKLREKFGERFHIVDRDDRIILVPVSENPLKELREEFSGTESSIEEMKNDALEEAVSEASK